MRLKSIYINKYKNLKNLSWNVESSGFLELFVGKNGSGKSNFFEALLEIFRHIYDVKIKNSRQAQGTGFLYNLTYEISGKEVSWSYDGDVLTSNQTTINEDIFPDNVLVYYSGQNPNVSDLLEKYESNYRRNIDRVEIEDSRVFIGVGNEYKKILLALITLLPLENHARQVVYENLGLHAEQQSIILTLKRPRKSYAREVDIEQFDQSTHFWGLRALPRTFVDRLLRCIRGEFQHRDIYNNVDQRYELTIDIALFRAEFSGLDAASLFGLFDNLKALEMIDDINAQLLLTDGSNVDLNVFSDGQFQSVYIYSLSEIFKSKNSITLLDEPDSFLHPEWQFGFLSQIGQISDPALSTNQVLMTSHSAATLMACPYSKLHSIQKMDNGNSEIIYINKGDLIKNLSGNKIILNENETIMSISTYLKNTNAPVLFTEGISDEYILDIAWKKLYQDQQKPFCINNAFDRHFLRNLMSRNELRQDYPDRLFFALFDFDEAFDDWNGISKGNKGQQIEGDPYKGLTRKLKANGTLTNLYAMLLPVPNTDLVKRQVLKPDNTPWGKGSESHMAVELLFFKEDLLGQFFERQPISGGGELIVFNGDKVHFAQEYVSSLQPADFEIFRPMFELIIQEINAKNNANAA